MSDARMRGPTMMATVNENWMLGLVAAIVAGADALVLLRTRNRREFTGDEPPSLFETIPCPSRPLDPVLLDVPAATSDPRMTRAAAG